MDKKSFSKGVERLINPINVGTLHFMQGFNKYLPKKVLECFVNSSAKQTPLMGFVVEPYAYFLFYEIENIQMAESLLPKGFKLIKTKIFDYDEPKYYTIFGCFRAHTSAFWGSRVEFYIIAENEKTGLLTWVIMDYDSNTISYDKRYGLRSPNSSNAVITINHEGTVLVDIKRDDNSREIVFESDIKNSKVTKLDQRLWLEGNLSVGYGNDLNGTVKDIFSLKFDPDEVDDALEIEPEKLNLISNTWYPGLFKSRPEKLACFPYAQHFISDSPGASTSIKNREELESAINMIDFKSIKVFSTKAFKNMFVIGTVISILTTTALLLIILFK